MDYYSFISSTLEENLTVKAGDIIGYVGSSGGPEINSINNNEPSLVLKIFVYTETASNNNPNIMIGSYFPIDSYMILPFLENNIFPIKEETNN